MEQMRSFVARQQAQLDQLQQQLQQQQVQQAKARQASPVGRDLSELRCIVDTRVMEKIPIFDGNEANFAEWRFTFEATCGLLGLEEVLRQSVLATHDEASINVYAQQPDVSLKKKAVYYLLVASCRGRAQVLVRGVPKHAGLMAWRQTVRATSWQSAQRDVDRNSLSSVAAR